MKKTAAGRAETRPLTVLDRAKTSEKNLGRNWKGTFIRTLKSGLETKAYIFRSRSCTWF